ncbi:MAG: rhodanese-like domain-containing protein [Anaerolineales bacterium]
MTRENFLIEASDLLPLLDDPKLRIFDATIMFYMNMTPEEIAKMPTAHEQYLAGHIPGAAFLDHDLFTDLDSPYQNMLASDEDLADQTGRIGIANDSVVILYATGILASVTRAWWMLRYVGVENVRVLNGGLAAWQQAGGVLKQGEKFYPPAQFEAAFSPEMFASKEEVQAAIDQSSVYTENALTQEWHDREHIPGSTCLPLTSLTPDWMTYIPEDQLLSLLDNMPYNERIITYCGGGIAATVNAMAYLMAGQKNVAVYDGSLFEWKGEGLPLTSKI